MGPNPIVGSICFHFHRVESHKWKVKSLKWKVEAVSRPIRDFML